MQITEKDWKSVIQYVQDKLKGQLYNMAEEGTEDSIGVDEDSINSLQVTCTLSRYLEATKQKKERVKAPENDLYEDAWKQFWVLWPATKSVPGTEYKSGAKMKSSEVKMRAKWVQAIYNDKKITVEGMYKAAQCYLEWAYEDSKRLGRNEMHYRNNMEVWLNQSQYITYSQVEPPKKQEEVNEYNNCA